MQNDDQNDEILGEFVWESRETLDRVEPLLIALEGGTDPEPETLNVIFRCFHSFKGTASFIGLNVTARVAHSAESLLDMYRRGARVLSPHLDLLCRTLDLLRELLDVVERDKSDAAFEERGAKIAFALDEIVEQVRVAPLSSKRSAHGAAAAKRPVEAPQDKSEKTATEPLEPAPVEAAAAEDEFIISQRFSMGEPDAMMAALIAELLPKFVVEGEEYLALVEHILLGLDGKAANPEQLAELFRAMHSFKGNCGICGLSQMEALTHGAESLVGRLQVTPALWQPAVTQLMLEVVDALRLGLAQARETNPSIPGIGELLQRLEQAGGGAPAQTVHPQAALPPKPRPVAERRASHPPGLPPAPAPTAAEPAGKASPPSAPPKEDNKQARTAEASIRVDTDKLDMLMNLVGELIIAETTVTQNPDLDGHEFENFQKAALNLNRITRALQEITMAVRMVPIAATFRKMIRLVRDVSTKQHKKVELISAGEETEVDKTVIESIADPLVHLIRNAVDHGIEPAEERVAKGKSATGHVWLEARHQGGEVWITLRDDGRGLDPKKILAKAIEKGVADRQRTYTDREITDFIFAPGFSTAAAVTDISGRGVGMDVVRRNIEGVGGRIETISQVGFGTTFTLRIPLTLAIIEGMLVKIGSRHYTVPLLAIRESVKATLSEITLTADGQELLSIRNSFLPIMRLHDLHGVEGATSSIEDGILVIVEANGQTACLLVDEVLGQRQTVIKSLPEYLKRIQGISGCSILHSGEISLILDVDGILGGAQRYAA